ncbi:MAG: hypothetical protein ACT443_12300 [Gemmatimonadota bacterium]
MDVSATVAGCGSGWPSCAASIDYTKALGDLGGRGVVITILLVGEHFGAKPGRFEQQQLAANFRIGDGAVLRRRHRDRDLLRNDRAVRAQHGGLEDERRDL